jgi:hypothetical protein
MLYLSQEHTKMLWENCMKAEEEIHLHEPELLGLQHVRSLGRQHVPQSCHRDGHAQHQCHWQPCSPLQSDTLICQVDFYFRYPALLFSGSFCCPCNEAEVFAGQHIR